MSPVRRAVIDVGTNSVKLLVAEVAGREVRPVLECSEQTRLGRGFYDTHRLQPAAIADTARAVAAFAGRARDRQTETIRVIATSAARDAENAEELAAAIRQASGLAVEIVTGDQEADWAFQGVATDPRFEGRGLFIVEVGGGSTQIIYSRSKAHAARHSFKLGAVRLLEKLRHTDPLAVHAWEPCRAFLSDFVAGQIEPAVRPALRDHGSGSLQLVGTGGTSSVLASMRLGLKHFDRAAIESAELSLPYLQAQTMRLWSLTLAERRHIPGLPAHRADVILTGIAIHLVLMETFGFENLKASTRGIRFGALLGSKADAGKELAG